MISTYVSPYMLTQTTVLEIDYMVVCNHRQEEPCIISDILTSDAMQGRKISRMIMNIRPETCICICKSTLQDPKLE